MRSAAPSSTPARGPLFAYAALAAAVAGIAWSAIFVRWADIPGSASAFYRVFIAACVLLPWRAMHQPAGAKRQAPGRRAWLMAIAAGILFALDLALFNTAIMRSSAATTSLLGSNAPVFVGLGSWLVFRRRPHRLFWAGLAASTAGVALMIWAGANAGAEAVRHDVIGDLMAIAAALCFAGYILAVAEARNSMDTLTLNTIAMAVSTVTLLPICLAIGAPLWNYPGTTWMALFWLGIVSQVGAYLAIAYALGHLPATVVSVGLLAQAPLTALLAASLLHERLTPLQLAGGALVLAGIYIVTRADAPAGPA
ncbi:MAG: DMT family transporter [Acidobacteriota bacterium]|nr:DMT family transporter [Acidobacteriota bacterium]